ncbi:hypothetical protein ACTMU2_31340 [Cupriavidus basilensis]
MPPPSLHTQLTNAVEDLARGHKRAWPATLPRSKAGCRPGFLDAGAMLMASCCNCRLSILPALQKTPEHAAVRCARRRSSAISPLLLAVLGVAGPQAAQALAKAGLPGAGRQAPGRHG